MNIPHEREICNTKKEKPQINCGFFVERAKGIEPSCSAWEADVLPLNYARNSIPAYYNTGWLKMQAIFCSEAEKTILNGGDKCSFRITIL